MESVPADRAAGTPSETMTVLTAANSRRERWRNGGGWTRQIAAGSLAMPVFPDGDPATEWDWRLSIAEIEADGPFSVFEGIDRVLVLLSGAGMDLVCDGGPITRLAQPLERFDFAGEPRIAAQLHDGPTSDFNLMWRRSRVRASLRILPLADALAALSASAWLSALHVVEGVVALDGHRLGAGDTVLVHASAAPARAGIVAGATVDQPGSALLITIDPANACAGVGNAPVGAH